MKLEILENLHEETMATVSKMPITAKGEKLRRVWTIAKPFLEMLSDSFFIPKKWRIVLDTVIEGVDELLKIEDDTEFSILKTEKSGLTDTNGNDLPGLGGF